MIQRLIAGALAASALAAVAASAVADSFPSEASASRVINVPKNKSLSFELGAPASRIVVAQPQTAQIVATTDHSFYVRGKALGSTNLLVYGGGGRLMEVIDVRVGYDAAALQGDLAAALPGERIAVRNLGEGLLLTGDVSTTGVAARAKAFAEKFAPEAVTSALTVRSSQQVILEVRVIEAGRSALQDIGFNIAANGPHVGFASGAGLLGAAPPQGILRIGGSVGSTNIDVTLQALEERGAIRTLARPNLTALTGEKSSFLAGGEFPFPVPAGKDLVTIEPRHFDVEQDRVRLDECALGERRFAVDGLGNLVPLIFQLVAHQGSHHERILGHQDAAGSGLHSRAARAVGSTTRVRSARPPTVPEMSSLC